MKKLIFIIALVLSANLLADNTHTYLYTFNQPTFSGTISQNKDSLLLNNKYIYFLLASGSATRTFDNGLKITSEASATQVRIYHKFSPNKTVSSMTVVLESSSSSNSYDIDNCSNLLPSYTPIPNSPNVTNITYNFPASPILGPCLFLNINNGSSVTIHSISFTYTDDTQSEDYNLYDRNTLIGSFNVLTNESYDIPSQPISSPSHNFQFAGWISSSSPIFDSTTPDFINQIPVNGLQTHDIHACYVHHRPASTATPTTLRLTPDSSSNTRTDFAFFPSSCIYLVSAHFRLKNNSVTPATSVHLYSYLPSDTIHTYLPAAYISKISYQYYTNFADTLAYVSSPITFSTNGFDGNFSCDSLSLSYYNTSQIDSRYYTLLPTDEITIPLNSTFPSDTALHINFQSASSSQHPQSVGVATATATSTSDPVALEDLSYSMTIDDSRYYFFSLPFAVPFSNITFSPISGATPLTCYYDYDDDNDCYLGDWVISRYNEPTNEWIDMKESDLANGLQPNVGYTIGITQPNCTTTVTFRSSCANAPYTVSPSQPSTTLTLSSTTQTNPIDQGWNLIGNPYYTPLSTLNIPANYILIPHTYDQTYDIIHKYAETTTETTLAPFSSFFIQSTSTSLTINPQTENCQLTTDNCKLTTDNCYHFNILCPNSNPLTILASDSYTEDYEIGFDLRSPTPDLDITHEGLAIYAAPLHTGDTITFSLPEGYTQSDLSIGSNIYIPYNWRLHILDDSHLVIEDNTPSALEDVEDIEDATPTHIYSMDGRLMPTTDITTLPAGVYILIVHGKPHKIITNGQH